MIKINFLYNLKMEKNSTFYFYWYLKFDYKQDREKLDLICNFFLVLLVHFGAPPRNQYDLWKKNQNI